MSVACEEDISTLPSVRGFMGHFIVTVIVAVTIFSSMISSDHLTTASIKVEECKLRTLKSISE